MAKHRQKGARAKSSTRRTAELPISGAGRLRSKHRALCSRSRDSVPGALLQDNAHRQSQGSSLLRRLVELYVQHLRPGTSDRTEGARRRSFACPSRPFAKSCLPLVASRPSIRDVHEVRSRCGHRSTPRYLHQACIEDTTWLCAAIACCRERIPARDACRPTPHVTRSEEHTSE